MKKVIKTLKGFIPLVIIFFAWWFVTRGDKPITPQMILPSITGVYEAFVKNISNGQLFIDLGWSLSRVAKGYVIAVLLGVTFGTLIALSRHFDEIISPLFHAIRSIPMLGWFPLIILWSGIGERSKIIIIVMGAFFPIMMNTVSGISQTPKSYVEVAKLGNMSNLRIFWKVHFPSALPQIFTGLRLGLSIAWMALVASELLAATSGIGFRISDARIKLRPEVVIMGMVVIGVLGVLLDKILTTIARIATSWTDT